MKNLGIITLIVLIAAVLILYLVSFQVRETESALVTRFGEPVRSHTEPDLYFKLPSPIEVVHKFDSRLRVFEGVMEETTTKGGEPIIVSSYIVWKIAEPQKFLESVQLVKNAEDRLRSRLRDAQNKVIGRHYFSDFVNTDASKIKFAAIEDDMLASLASEVKATYGIEVKQVGIRQLGVSEKVTKDVFARMSADRQGKTATIITQGNAEATRIKSDAERKRTELLAAAEARAKAIQGSGDAEAAKYYKMLEADPDLAMFLRDIEALKNILQERSTIVLSADSQPFKLIREMPDLVPQD